MKKTIYNLFLLLALLSFSFVAFAQKSEYIPNIYLHGFTGTNVTGEADVVAPLFSNTSNNLLFAYAHGQYSHEKPAWANGSWTGSFGFGYRQIMSLFGYSSALGAYVLGEYSKTPDDHKVWLVSPGIESLGRTYDFRLNGYIPVSKHDWTTTKWADEAGNYDYISFQGHRMFDAKFVYHEQAGIGGDAEVGRRIFKCHGVLVKGYLDGYYFHMKNNGDILGGGGRVTIQPNSY